MFDVHIRVIDGVADAGLRGKIHDNGGLIGLENLVHKTFVSDASPDKDMPDGGFNRVDQAEPILLELGIVVIHHIVCENTVDEDVLNALSSKNVTQEKLIAAVKAQLY